MTYCVGMRLQTGIVVIADTRTNAGIDNVSTYKKLHTLADDGERLIVAASAGSLSVTQAMLSILKEGLEPLQDGEPRRFIDQAPSMFRVAELVGEALVIARREVGRTLEGTSINADVSLLLAGRVGEEVHKLYLIYPEGNCIETQQDCPYAQIGELKYGKPILDRALQWDSLLDEAVKVGLISFDSTMRSNLSVGLPLDMIVIPADRAQPVIRRRIDAQDEYFRMLSAMWGRLLNEARQQVPDPPFLHM
ncbi:MAG: peptidase [Sphingomonadales bacterium]|nr:peptidase [Sphingomonadales bacterium]